MKKYLVFMFLLCTTIACTKVIEKGYYLNDVNAISSITEGLTHQNNIANLLGEPYFIFNNNIWFYYSYSVNKYGFKKIDIVGEKILLLEFDEYGILKNKIYKEKTDNFLNFQEFKKDLSKEEQDLLFENLFKDFVPTIVPQN